MSLTNPPSTLQHKRLELVPYSYVLVIAEAGSDEGAAANARLLAEAAARIAGHGYRTVFIGDNADAAGWNDCLHQITRLTADELAIFILTARLIVSNRHETAVQASNYGRPCLAVTTAIDPATLETSALSHLDHARFAPTRLAAPHKRLPAYLAHARNMRQRERAT